MDNTYEPNYEYEELADSFDEYLDFGRQLELTAYMMQAGDLLEDAEDLIDAFEAQGHRWTQETLVGHAVTTYCRQVLRCYNRLHDPRTCVACFPGRVDPDPDMDDGFGTDQPVD